MSEADKDPLDIKFTATVPFRCPDTHLFTKCNISVNLTTTENIVVKGVVADKPCTISFTQSDSDNLYHVIRYISIENKHFRIEISD